MKAFCPVCDAEFNAAKDFFITINERKAPSVNVCSLACATLYIKED